MAFFRQIGYKFEPTKEQLVGYFLRMKANGQPLPNLYPQLIEYNIYTNHPFNVLFLTKGSRSVNGDEDGLKEGYFFTQRNKVSKGSVEGVRKSRNIKGHGTWAEKAKTTPVNDKSGNKIGELKYYKFKPDPGFKNNELNEDEWCMHEYTLSGYEDYALAHITRKQNNSRKRNNSSHDYEAGPSKRNRVEADQRPSFDQKEMDNTLEQELGQQHGQGQRPGEGISDSESLQPLPISDYNYIEFNKLEDSAFNHEAEHGQGEQVDDNPKVEEGVDNDFVLDLEQTLEQETEHGQDQQHGEGEGISEESCLPPLSISDYSLEVEQGGDYVVAGEIEGHEDDVNNISNWLNNFDDFDPELGFEDYGDMFQTPVDDMLRSLI